MKWRGNTEKNQMGDVGGGVTTRTHKQTGKRPKSFAQSDEPFAPLHTGHGRVWTAGWQALDNTTKHTEIAQTGRDSREEEEEEEEEGRAKQRS